MKGLKESLTVALYLNTVVAVMLAITALKELSHASINALAFTTFFLGVLTAAKIVNNFFLRKEAKFRKVIRKEYIDRGPINEDSPKRLDLTLRLSVLSSKKYSKAYAFRMLLRELQADYPLVNLKERDITEKSKGNKTYLIETRLSIEKPMNYVLVQV